MKYLKLVSAATVLALSGNVNAATIVNGSFETGDFFGWTATDIAEPFAPLIVEMDGSRTIFSDFALDNIIQTTDGLYAVTNGFDGGGPADIRLAQDIGVISFGDVLTFDYRAGWDLITFSPPNSLDREFNVVLETAGGGSFVSSFNILTARMGTDTVNNVNGDTGPLSAAIDLSDFAGLDARINFVWTVPEVYTGPAIAQLDNVAISSVPVPAAVWLFGSGLLGLLGVARRKYRS